MSIRALNWAFGLDLNNSTQKFILVALADSADDFGICWPSYDTIGKKCSIARRSVIRSINALVEQGLITKTKRYRKDGFNNSNAFCLNMGVDIADDHPLKEVVTQSHPMVTESHSGSDTESPKPSLNPLKEKKALTRIEFMREVDQGYTSDDFTEFSHLTESEIKAAASACFDHWAAKGEWPAGDPKAIMRNWIRGGIKNKSIRSDKTEAKASEGSKYQEPETPKQDWHDKAKAEFSEGEFRAWIRPLYFDGNQIIAPSEFHASTIKREYAHRLAQIGVRAEIIHKTREREAMNA